MSVKSKYKFIPIENRIDEMLNFLKSKIPLILDVKSGDLKYDTKNMYYRIYKYIRDKEGKE